MTWERAATSTASSRRLEVYLIDALDGEWGRPVAARGHDARLVISDQPEPGSVSIWWDGGGLGCTNGVKLAGAGVSEAEATAEVDALR